MAKIIKKNLDIVLIFGIGLFLVIVGMLGIDKLIPFPTSVQAATSAQVAVSATVAQSEELTVTLVNSGVTVNGATTNATTTDTTVPLGTLSTGANTIAAHTLTMTTNAVGGYTVNTKYDHKLWSATATSTKDIDDFSGSNASPAVFSGAGVEAFGYTTEDYSLGTGTASRFQGGKWAAFTASDLEVAYNTGPVNATTTKIGYQAGISAITPAATDYGCTVTYTMTSTF